MGPRFSMLANRGSVSCKIVSVLTVLATFLQSIDTLLVLAEGALGLAGLAFVAGALDADRRRTECGALRLGCMCVW